MIAPEDVLKAVEALIEIFTDFQKIYQDRGCEFMDALISNRFERLRLGCVALRMEKRGSPYAREILDREEPSANPVVPERNKGDNAVE